MDGKPAQPLHARAFDVRRLRGQRGVVGLQGGIEQGTEAALLGGVVAADRSVVGVEVRPDRGEADPPAGAAAVAAVDGGEGMLSGTRVGVSGIGQRAVVAPEIAGGRAGRAVDPGELANPQVQVDAECGAPDRGPDVAERSHDVGQEGDPLILAGAHWTGRRLGEQSFGELPEVNGLLGGGDELVHQGVGLHEREQRLGGVPNRAGQSRRVGVVEAAEDTERPGPRVRARSQDLEGRVRRRLGPTATVAEGRARGRSCGRRHRPSTRRG